MHALLLAVVSAFLLLAGPVLATDTATSHYTLEGAVDGRFQDARCSLRFSKYGKVWTMQLVPEDAYSPAANLFFSPKFGRPEPGEYPIAFAYRADPAALGGSVSADSETYSFDTDGAVNFSRFDHRVVGTFSFASKSSDGAAVSASGAFDCPRGDALK